MHRRFRTAMLALGAGLAVLSLVSLGAGSAELSGFVLAGSRVPRLAALLLAGSGLAVSGLIAQTVWRNRFVSPETTGTMDAAGLGYLVALLAFPAGDGYAGTEVLLVRVGITMAVAAAAAVGYFALVARIGTRDPVTVPLVGIVFGSVLRSVGEIIAYRFDLVQNLSAWVFADFSGVIAGRYELLYGQIIVLALAFAYAGRFMAAAMGRDFAVSIGSGYRSAVAAGIGLISASSALALVTVGRVPFIGLIVPNLVSYAFGDRLPVTIPLAAVSGALVLVAADLIGRVLIAPYEIPVGLIMSLVGGGFFFAVLRVSRGRFRV